MNHITVFDNLQIRYSVGSISFYIGTYYFFHKVWYMYMMLFISLTVIKYLIVVKPAAKPYLFTCGLHVKKEDR